MKRRDVLEMMAAGALAPVQRRRGRARAAVLSANAWRFDLDQRNRWILRRGPEVAVRYAEIAIELAGAEPVPLSALEGVRRFRTGGSSRVGGAWNVVGRTSGVEVDVQLQDGEAPAITVRVRGLEEPQELAALHFTRGLAIHHDSAWLNGYQSWSACRTLRLDAQSAATGHWQLALVAGEADGRTGGPLGLAFSFGEEDGGAGEFVIAGRALEATSRFGRRPVSADHAPAVATLRIVPSRDPLTALGMLAALASPGGPAATVPAGWCSWYELYARVTEADVLANLELARERFDPRAFRTIQLDDGYQRAAGDWETNDKFPHGHRWLTDRIHDAGFQAGLWLAPFAVTAPSGIPTARPDWLLLDVTGLPLALDDQPHWGGRAYALDASLREVQDWLRELARHAVTEWGYDYLKLDFLHYGARGERPRGGVSPHEALRAGLRALRQGAGRAYLLGCGAPLQHALGLFDGMRIGNDVDATWDGVQPGARAALERAHYQGRAWHNDPDALLVREPLTGEEARAWASVVALSGGVTMASDHLPRLAPERLALLQRTMPVARITGRALDLFRPERALAPALVLGGQAVVPLPRRWKFRSGDDPAWSAADIDDTSWDTIDVGVNWERAGHDGLDGFAWYRAHFRAPRRPAAGGGRGALLALELGKIDDVDETFINGVKIGGTGTLPPLYAGAWEAWRRYAVAPDAVRWGADNVVAVRVYDGGGPGGMWSLRRDRPPAQILARAAEDRWMVALINWDDATRRDTIELAAHGAAGAFAAYDVWSEERVSDVQGRLTMSVEPHSARVLALRRARTFPFVLGSTRHIVQGVVDIAEERWDPRRRRLTGRSTMLDGRPYGMTIATPPRLLASSCGGDGECRIARQGHGAIHLEFAPGRDDVEWELDF